MPTLSSSKPVIVITRGDPAGIGPEITEKALKNRTIRNEADFTVIGEMPASVTMGVVSRESGHIAVRNIEKAVRLLDSIRGRKALVTAPINKQAVKEAGYAFAGHTEMLAAFTGSHNVTMMFSCDHVRLALVTRHIPLAKVAGALTGDAILAATLNLYEALTKRFGIKRPRIGIAGLNPHAGDGGAIGDEERVVIQPAVKKLSSRLKNVIGPYPPDIIMRDLYLKKIDAAVSMYHDQGLPAFKMLYFERGVNVTLGLPFIRTSPDHGTAYAIAGKGCADPLSMIESIRLAIKLAR
ncbi:MAG: 4-hydroxythreonine-4-phosphate dehydrogenase PdxA [Candidatus Omnitrophica bacterium]|nr:4-hydroxythreonine-4-phosphate dehydrogenase PdxA [Candidatus Omnitrophota bacterium]